MSKNKNDGFDNLAARKFNDVQKSDLLSQSEVFKILETDIQTILNQMTASRNRKGKYPQYVANIFGNLSAPLFFSDYVDSHVKVKKGKLKTDLSDEDMESLREILADAYKKSVINYYNQQAQEFVDRNILISTTFIRLAPKQYRLAKKFGLEKGETRDLTIQIYGNPISNMKFVKRLVDASACPNKKKLKLLQKMYGDRFVSAVGAALTVVSNNSDCIEMLFNFMMKKKLKKRAKYVRAYAEAYKKNKTHNFRINEDFIVGNRKLIKELKHVDIGYKKAFSDIIGKNNGKKKEKTGKKKNLSDSVSFAVD